MAVDRQVLFGGEPVTFGDLPVIFGKSRSEIAGLLAYLRARIVKLDTSLADKVFYMNSDKCDTDRVILQIIGDHSKPIFENSINGIDVSVLYYTEDVERRFLLLEELVKAPRIQVSSFTDALNETTEKHLLSAVVRVST